MAGVQYADKSQTVKLKFIRNVCYNGTDYGPDYKEQVAVVDASWAHNFLQNGKAEFYQEPKKEESKSK